MKKLKKIITALFTIIRKIPVYLGIASPRYIYNNLSYEDTVKVHKRKAKKKKR